VGTVKVGVSVISTLAELGDHTRNTWVNYAVSGISRLQEEKGMVYVVSHLVPKRATMAVVTTVNFIYPFDSPVVYLEQF